LLAIQPSFLEVGFQDWRDERLQWNASDYCGIEHIYLSTSDVWIPEITVVEAHSSEDYREDYKKFVWVCLKLLEISQYQQMYPHQCCGYFIISSKMKALRLQVNSSGFANFFVPTLTSTICAIEVQDFPFDHQECYIKMMSQSFSAWEYGIKTTMSPSLAGNSSAFASMGNGEWQIKNVSRQSVFMDTGDQFPFEMASLLSHKFLFFQVQ
ncbi:hypothetical protein ANCCAN_18944, partial [Ancylostoma caninum]